MSRNHFLSAYQSSWNHLNTVLPGIQQRIIGWSGIISPQGSSHHLKANIIPPGQNLILKQLPYNPNDGGNLIVIFLNWGMKTTLSGPSEIEHIRTPSSEIRFKNPWNGNISPVLIARRIGKWKIEFNETAGIFHSKKWFNACRYVQTCVMFAPYTDELTSTVGCVRLLERSTQLNGEKNEWMFLMCPDGKTNLSTRAENMW